MPVEKCTRHDVDFSLDLYQATRTLQQEKQMVVWPLFERSFPEKKCRKAGNGNWCRMIHLNNFEHF